MPLKRNEWWAICHAHNNEPCSTDGRAALFETKEKAFAYRRQRARIVGAWNLTIRKVVVS